MDTFNPFEDRLSRDIRNSLSEGLAEAVESGSAEKLEKIVRHYRKQPLGICYQQYVEDRYQNYLQALKLIQTREVGGMVEAIPRSLVLWNLALFFEVHELLEHAWYTAKSPLKETLQALIRAAGVYIKLEYGYNDSAKKIAAKAIPVLETNREILTPYCKVEQLIAALKNLKNPPPLLELY